MIFTVAHDDPYRSRQSGKICFSRGLLLFAVVVSILVGILLGLLLNLRPEGGSRAGWPKGEYKRSS